MDSNPPSNIFLEGENTRETFDLANLSGLSKYFSKALKQPVFLKENRLHETLASFFLPLKAPLGA